jgi:hypothetical protein
MKKIAFGFLLFIFALGVAQPVYAHGGQPRLEINIDHTNPGAVVDVRGVEFGYDDLVMLALIGSEAEIALGETTANGEGEFQQIVVLPPDLIEGTYYFRATTIHHWVISPPLTVWGTAVLEGGGQGERDEDDGLLAPMPTFAPAVVTAPVAAVPVEATPASAANRNVPALIALMVIGSTIVAIVFAIKRKNSQ